MGVEWCCVGKSDGDGSTLHCEVATSLWKVVLNLYGLV